MIEYWRTPRGEDTALVCSFGVGDALSTETTERMGNTLSAPSKPVSCGGSGWVGCVEEDCAVVWPAFRSCWSDSAGLPPSGDDIWGAWEYTVREKTITAFAKDFYQSRDLAREKQHSETGPPGHPEKTRLGKKKKKKKKGETEQNLDLKWTGSLGNAARKREIGPGKPDYNWPAYHTGKWENVRK